MSPTSVAPPPRGIIHCPVTPYDANNEIDLDTFGRVIDFLVRHHGDSLCVNLHLAESLNLTHEERERLAEAAVEAAAGRSYVIVNVSTPGTDQAIALARHAEKIGADAVMAINPYHWKPTQEGLYEHFAAILRATRQPVLGYNSPVAQGGLSLAPATLIRLMTEFPHYVGLKEASHNWETYMALGRAGRGIRPDFCLFVGTEWFIPGLTLGGRAGMSIQGGICPRLVGDLFEMVDRGEIAAAFPLQDKLAELYGIAMPEYPAPSKAMWEIMGRPVGRPRLPCRPIDAAGMKRLEADLARLGILDSEPHGWG